MKATIRLTMAVLAAAGTMAVAGGCVSQRALENERAARAAAEHRAEAALQDAQAAKTAARAARQKAKAAAAERDEQARKAEAALQDARDARQEAMAAAEERDEQARKAEAARKRAHALATTPKAAAEEREVRQADAAAVPAGTASEAARALTVRVDLEDGLPPGIQSVFQADLRARLEGGLAAAGFTVVDQVPADVAVRAVLSARQVNARGSRVVWTGSAEVSVFRATAPNPVADAPVPETVARTWKDVHGGEARDDEEAQKRLAERLAEELVPFAAEAVNRAGARVRCAELEIRKAWVPAESAGYPTKFAEEVLAMPGVYRCRVTEFDKAGALRAEIAYDAQQYPDGFANRLRTRQDLGFNKTAKKGK